MGEGRLGVGRNNARWIPPFGICGIVRSVGRRLCRGGDAPRKFVPICNMIVAIPAKVCVGKRGRFAYSGAFSRMGRVLLGNKDVVTISGGGDEVGFSEVSVNGGDVDTAVACFSPGNGKVGGVSLD